MLGMYFDRFDVCEAYWLFATEWHRGQWSSEYAVFGRLSNLGFKPSPVISKRTLTENGRMILANLIRKARKGQTIRRYDVYRDYVQR